MDAFAVLMEHLCDVYGPAAAARDGGGGVEVTWPTVRQANVPFLLNVSPASDTDRFGQDQLIGPVTAATFYTGATRGDLLVVRTGPTLVGSRLRVTGIKSQPGVDFLGFTPIVHLSLEQVI